MKQQVSASVSQPRTLQQYQDAFLSKQNESGWLHVKWKRVGTYSEWTSPDWTSYWCVFEEGVLTFAVSEASKVDDRKSIKIETVVSLRADAGKDAPCINIITTDQVDVNLKANSKDENNKWIFAFQKSVALVLSTLDHCSADHDSSISNLGNDRRNTDFRRLESKNSNRGRSIATEDIIGMQTCFWNRSYSIRSNMHTFPHVDLMIDADTSIPLSKKSQCLENEEWSKMQEASIDMDIRSTFSDLEGETNFCSNGTVDNDDSELIFQFDNEEDLSGNDQQFCGTIGDHCRTDNLEYSIGDKTISKNLFSSSSSSSSLPSTSHSSYDGHGCSKINNFDSEDTTAEPTIRWISGNCSKLGPRDRNEDAFVVINDIYGYCSSQNEFYKESCKSQGYYAVFDGHCGNQAAIFCSNEFHRILFKHPLFCSDLQSAILETCKKVDDIFLKICREKNINAGTTALGAIIRQNSLTVFGIGDCQAVLSRHKSAMNMNKPHKPGRPDETKRVLDANGWITEEKELYMGRLHRMDLSDPLIVDKAKDVKWVTINRVCGEIAVSRSIGDPDYKGFMCDEPVKTFFSWPDNHNQMFKADLIIPDPEFTSTNLMPEDEFLIIASDGLWDVITEQESVERVEQGFKDGQTPDQISEDLVDLALRLGSSDNVTAIIVQFFHEDLRWNE